MSCDCLERRNTSLKPGGFYVEQNILGGRGAARVKVAVGSTGARRPPALYADYCPFCGAPYPEKEVTGEPEPRTGA